MHFRKKQNRLSLMEAVDNLSLLAELTSPNGKEDAEPVEFLEEQSEDHVDKRSWYAVEDLSYNVQKARNTFLILYNYLKNMYETEEEQLRDPEMQKGIQAIMLLAMEAAVNLNRFFSEIPEAKNIEKITEWPEYKELQQFYLTIIAPKMQTRTEQIERWQEEWGIGEEEGISDQKRGLRDIESVRRDQDYELFLIRRDDGRPFFNRALLRHIHFVQQFDELIVNNLEEDPLAKVRYFSDRDAHLAAREILQTAAPVVDEFYKMALRHKEIPLVSMMNQAMMALMLAANPRNLLQTTLGKCCLNYLIDFQLFFRSFLTTKEYRGFIERPPPASERLAHTLIHLSHILAAAFFTRGIEMTEMHNVLRLLIEEGEQLEEVASQSRSPLSLWNALLDEDDMLRSALKISPYGPVRNAIEVFNQRMQLQGFDPIFQQNFPHFLYALPTSKIDIACLHLPCPTFQDSVKQAVAIPEFHSFLRSLNKNQCHLMIHLQDRTSWQEYARCIALEELSKKPKYHDVFKLVTLAVGTDFYFQSGTYFHQDEADDFIQQFKQQIESGESCGFYFPQELTFEILRPFNHAAMGMIHKVFFGSKKKLIHKNRLDFIEIFYLFFTLKCIEEFSPSSISFTSKDSLDSGAAMHMQLFALLSKFHSKEDKEALRMLLYASALIVRNRAVDVGCAKRAISALSLIWAELEAHHKDVVSASRKLFKNPLF